MTVEELAKQVDDLKNEIILMKMDATEARNRLTRDLENIHLNLKNLATLANGMLVELEKPEPTRNPNDRRPYGK